MHIQKTLSAPLRSIDHFNDSVVLLAVIIAFAAFPLLAYKNVVPTGDLSEYLNNPFRLLHGELPYRDFWLIFPPGEVYLPFAVYKIFGFSINNVMIFSGFVGFSIGIAAFYLAKAVFSSNSLAVAVSTIILFNGVPARYSGLFYNHAYFLCLLLGALFLVRFIIEERGWYLIVAGLFSGAAMYFKIFLAGAMICATIAALLYLHAGAGQGRKLITTLACYLAGVAFVPALTAIQMYDLLPLMFQEVFVNSVKHAMYMKIPYFTMLHNYPIHALFPLLVVPLGLWSSFTGKSGKKDNVILFFFIMWGILTYPKALGRSDIHHLALAITPLYVVLVLLCRRLLADRPDIGGKTGLAVGGVLAVIALYFFGRGPEILIKNTLYSLDTHYTVEAPHGRLYYRNAEEAAWVDGIIRFIEKNTAENDYVFVTPWHIPPIYALTGRRNPTYYDSVVDLIVSGDPAKTQAVCHDITRRDTKVLVNSGDANRWWGVDGGLEANEGYNSILNCAESLFLNSESLGAYTIYSR